MISNVVVAADVFFDDFSSGSSNWTPVSGGWVSEDGKYKNRTMGESFVSQSSPPVIADDFSSPDPTIITTSTPFTDSFTEPNGTASQWSVKRGNLSVLNNEYAANNGSTTLSIPSDTALGNLTDYRITAKIKREGAADAYGYSIIYFRLNMLDATKDNSYALLFRQTGKLDLYKRVNGNWDTYIAGVSIPKDNNWHNVTVIVAGTSLKVWFDKAENLSPDMNVNNLNDYNTGTIGVGTQAWNSKFDDIQIESVSVSYRWSVKNGAFNIQNGLYNALASGGLTLSIPSNTSSFNWNNYKITTKIRREGPIDADGYAAVYFRLKMVSSTSFDSYAIIFQQKGTASLFKVTNGNMVAIGKFNFPKDNAWHDVIINVMGANVEVWFDKDTSQNPDFKFKGLRDYREGTVGLGTITQNSSFDDFTVTPLTSVEIMPFYLYLNSGESTVITVRSSLILDNLQLSVMSPSNDTWNISNPFGCAGNYECHVLFPDDFPGANINANGTYVISAAHGSNASYALLEVREKPLFTFIQITDVHENMTALSDFVTSINGSQVAPPPAFIVVTGDLTNNGNQNTLTQIKSELDKLTIPYYVTTGNHDTDVESGNQKGYNWSGTFGAQSFSYGWLMDNFLFLAMDINAPYGGYGTNLNSVQHKAWLQNMLANYPDKYVFLFAHYSLEALRDGGTCQNYWQGEGISSQVRPILESHGKVILEMAGHDHLNGLAASNGIYYSTTSDYLQNGEYRYIEVFEDRLEALVFKRKGSYYDYDQYVSLCSLSSDSSHDVETYIKGLPAERQFRINYQSRKTEVMDAITVAGDAGWQDYTYEAEITLKNDSTRGENLAGMIFRYTDKNNYYSVMIDSSTDSVILQKKQNGDATDLATVPTVINIDTVYHLKADVNENQIKVYLDNALIIDSTDSTFPSGRIGLRSYRALNIFDNIMVTNIRSTLPDMSVPTTLDFCSLAAGSVREKPVIVTNNGIGTLTIQSISALPYPFSISQDNCLGLTLGQYESCSIIVSFSPSDNIPYTGTFNIGTDDPNSNNVTVNLTGAGSLTPSFARIDIPTIWLEGQALILDASNSCDNIISYDWDINGDGTFEFSSSISTQTYTFAQNGLYPIKLKVTSNVGLTDEATAVADILDTAPSVSFNMSAVGGVEPLNVNFLDTSTAYDGIISQSWNFGDGSPPVSGQSVSHVFNQNGTFSVSLTVTDSDGSTISGRQTITVNDTSPVVDFTASITNGPAPLMVNFTNNSTGYDQPLTYLWDFDNDGFVDSTAQNPTFVYSDEGTYTVNLTVVDSDGSAISLKWMNYINVTCTFLPVRILSDPPVYFYSLQTAYDNATDGDTIQTWDTEYFENLNINRKIAVILEGGYDCSYTSNTGKTTKLNGDLNISDGFFEMENLVLK